MSSLTYIYSWLFCEIFFSADLYRLCKLGIFWLSLWKIVITLFCIIGINRLKEKFHRKARNIYMLNYSLPCSCSYNLSSFWLILKQQWTIEISIFSNSSHQAILNGGWGCRTQYWKRAIQIPFHQSLAAISPVVSEEKIKVYDVRRMPSDGKSSPGLWPVEVKREVIIYHPSYRERKTTLTKIRKGR